MKKVDLVVVDVDEMNLAVGSMGRVKLNLIAKEEVDPVIMAMD